MSGWAPMEDYGYDHPNHIISGRATLAWERAYTRGWRAARDKTGDKSPAAGFDRGFSDYMHHAARLEADWRADLEVA